MTNFLQFVLRHDAAFLFAAVFIDQLGAPLPAAPWLLAAGAMIATGETSPATAFTAAIVGALLADLIWFYLGRSYGNRALGVLCRVAKDPGACVQRTQNFFTKYGMGSVVAAKFVPVMKTLAPALAGNAGVTTSRFLFFDGLGAIIYAGVFIVIGFVFSEQVEEITNMLGRHGNKMLVYVGVGIALYFLYLWLRRRRR